MGLFHYYSYIYIVLMMKNVILDSYSLCSLNNCKITVMIFSPNFNKTPLKFPITWVWVPKKNTQILNLYFLQFSKFLKYMHNYYSIFLKFIYACLVTLCTMSLMITDRTWLFFNL